MSIKPGSGKMLAVGGEVFRGLEGEVFLKLDHRPFMISQMIALLFCVICWCRS